MRELNHCYEGVVELSVFEEGRGACSACRSQSTDSYSQVENLDFFFFFHVLHSNVNETSLSFSGSIKALLKGFRVLVAKDKGR